MRKVIGLSKSIAGFALLCGSSALFAGTSIAVKDNADIALTLSQSNYNRVFIKNDEILDFAFPEGALALRQDKEDGSVYLMPVGENPFTLFLTTKAGRHFSVTLKGEASLGKTIELVPEITAAKKAGAVLVKSTGKKRASHANEAAPEAILSLITHMEKHEVVAGLRMKKESNRVERWAKGLVLLPKEAWDAMDMKGEVISLYNGSKEPLELSEDWFVEKDVKAIKLSKPTLAPKEYATLYRVKGASNG